MNKKNLIIISAGLLLVAVLAVLYLVFASQPEVPDGPDAENIGKTENGGASGDSFGTGSRVFSVPDEKSIESVNVFKSGNEAYEIYRNKDIDSLLIREYEHFSYSNDFSQILSGVSTLTVTGEITDPLDDKEYGIAGMDSPYVITVSSSSGITETLYVGGEMLTGSGYYCKKEGEDGIYTIGPVASHFFKETYSLLSPLLANPLEASRYHYTEDFQLFCGLSEAVHIVFVPEAERDGGDVYGYYKMIYPGEYTPSDINYDSILKMLITPTASTIVTTDLSDENLIKYGFMDAEGNPSPSYELRYTLDGETRIIYFGTKTDDGLIYVLSPAFGFIGLAAVENHFPFLEWDLIKYINPYLFGININYVARVNVSGRGFSDTYLLSGKKDELTVKNQQSGAEIDTQNFRQFYRVLLMTGMEGYADSKSTDDWMLSFTVETTGGKIYEYKFYRISTRRCYYTVNGEGEFYVNVDAVEKILSDAAKLAEGTEINADSKI